MPHIIVICHFFNSQGCENNVIVKIKSKHETLLETHAD